MKAMEVDEKPSEDYSDIGGLDKQIQELVEAIVLPVTHKARRPLAASHSPALPPSAGRAPAHILASAPVPWWVHGWRGAMYRPP